MSTPRDVRIQVVDVEQITRSDLSDVYFDIDCVVDYACEGPATLEMVRRRRYDIAILAPGCLDMKDVTLNREVKKARAGTVPIAVMAFVGPAPIDQVQAEGAWRILSKPVDLPRLLDLVD